MTLYLGNRGQKWSFVLEVPTSGSLFQ